LTIIRINVDHEKSIAIIKERKTANVFMIENVLLKRKLYMQKPNIDMK